MATKLSEKLELIDDTNVEEIEKKLSKQGIEETEDNKGVEPNE